MTPSKGETVLTVTPAAAEQIRASAQQGGIGNAALRIAARLDAQGTIEYGMGFDEKSGDDLEVESNGIRLLVAPGSVELLSGATLDYVEINPGEMRYIFMNPNDPSHKAPGRAR